VPRQEKVPKPPFLKRELAFSLWRRDMEDFASHTSIATLPSGLSGRERSHDQVEMIFALIRVIVIDDTE
jgi:hypothetical protein